MITLMVLILMALVFFTLYEQTYGSWVVFTDRMMTKDFFPSLISRGRHAAAVVLRRAGAAHAGGFLRAPTRSTSAIPARAAARCCSSPAPRSRW